MDSLKVRCTFVDKCAALRAPPAQCALARAAASVGPKLDALVTAASHETRCGLKFKAARTTQIILQC